MSLCSTCNAVNIQEMLAQAASRSSSEPPIQPYLLHYSLFVTQPYEDSCDFCSFIVAHYLKTRIDEFCVVHLRIEEDGLYFDPPMYKLGIAFDDSGLFHQSNNLELFSHHSELALKHSDAGHPVQFGGHQEVLKLTAPKGNQDYYPKESLLKAINSNSGSPQAFALATGWFHKCVMEHSLCLRSLEMHYELPTRLIEVGVGSENPRLYIAPGGNSPGSCTHGSWVCLSYCWGGDSSFILTKESMPSLLQGVPLLAFPPTLRDAITITRTLGVKYLWIDALYILQDSIADWELEAPKMADVYSNAIVTIIASNSPTVKSGIFHERQERATAQLPWGPRNGTVSPGLTPNEGLETSIGVRMDTQGDLRNAALSSRWADRGWTLQEAMLSWRTLTYSREQMVWSCSEHTVLEIGGEYSGRSLTKESDRLPGIGGLALSIERGIRDTYCAGLWEQDLIFSLSWKLDAYGSELREKQHMSAICPSWSWISPGLRIEFPLFDARSRRLSKYEEYARVLEIDIKYIAGVYGPMESGKLVLSGPCYHCVRLGNGKLVESTTAKAEGKPHWPACDFLLNEQIRTDFELTVRYSENHQGDWVVLQLFRLTNDSIIKREQVFLVLECVETSSAGSLRGNDLKLYRRAGLIQTDIWRMDLDAIFKELDEKPWPEDTVTII